MASYTVTLLNQTSSTWYLVIYVTLPNAVGMLSVAWQLQAVAPGGGTGSVSWNDTPYACLGTRFTTGVQGFTQTLARAAAIDQAWSAFLNAGALDLRLTGLSITPGNIEITNNAGQLTNLALGFGGSAAVYAPDVPSSITAGFIPQPTYWVMLAQSIAAGDVVARAATPAGVRRLAGSAQVAGLTTPPQPLQFPSGQTTAHVTASPDGSGVRVSIAYS